MAKKTKKPYLTDSAVVAGIDDALCSDAKGTSTAGRPDPYHGIETMAGGQRAAAPLGRTPDTIPSAKRPESGESRQVAEVEREKAETGLRAIHTLTQGDVTHASNATLERRGYPTDEERARHRERFHPDCKVCAGLEAEVRIAGMAVRSLMVALAASYVDMSVEDLKRWEAETAPIRETLARARVKLSDHQHKRGHR